MRTHTVRLAAAAVLGVVGFGALVFAQSGGLRPMPATLDDLLAEVKGLRADIAQSSGTTIRTQLILARLQVEEQRINNLVKQLADTRDQLTTTRNNISGAEANIRSSEEELQKTPSPDQRPTPGELKVLLGWQQVELKRLQSHDQDLQAQQSDLMNQYAVEQSRWNDFNARLDALERMLPQPR
jgi:hypothetical protein